MRHQNRAWMALLASVCISQVQAVEFTVPTAADFHICLQETNPSPRLDTTRIVSWFQAASGQRDFSFGELDGLRSISTLTTVKNQLIEFEDAVKSISDDSDYKRSCNVFADNLLYSFERYKSRLINMPVLGTNPGQVNRRFKVSVRFADVYDRFSDPKRVVATLPMNTPLRMVGASRDLNGIEWLKVVYQDNNGTRHLGWIRRDKLAVR